MLIKTTIFPIALLQLSIYSSAQLNYLPPPKTHIDSIYDHVYQVEELMQFGNKKYVASYIFDSILHETQNKISGTQVKDGKTAATSAILQDKSMTLNVNIMAGRWCIQPTASGSSTKDFISVFSGDKYQRTLTGGLNFLYFSKSSGSFEPSDILYIHNALRYVKKQPIDTIQNGVEALVTSFIEAFKDVRVLYKQMEEKDIDFDTVNVAQMHALKTLYETATKLVKAKILPPDWDQYSADTVAAKVRYLALIHPSRNWGEVYRQNKKLAAYDSVQRNAYWTKFRYQWWSGGIQFNQAIDPLFDSTAGPAHLFETDKYDQFWTAQISYNILHSKFDKNMNTWISPTFKFSTQKIFNPDSLISIQKQSTMTVGTDSLVVVNKSTSFYRKDLPRIGQLIFQVPVTRYWLKAKVGVDLSASIQLLPSIDQVSAKAGVYFPISSGTNVVVVEPLLNFTRLNQGHLQFIKDQLAFGFSVSVSIPKYVTGN